jgi:hypothetical protein
MLHDTLSASALGMFSCGLAAAFLIVIGFVVWFVRTSKTDQGFAVLLFLFCLIFFLIAFSFLVAGAVPGHHIKIAVAAVDAAVFLGAAFLAHAMIRYLKA